MAVIEILHADLRSRLELARLLQGLGHQPVQAASLRDFLEIRDAKPELLVFGETEGADGREVVAEVRSAAPGLPVLVCLAAHDATRAMEYLLLGATDCLAPPVSREALGAGVKGALVPRRTALELEELPPPPPPPRARALALLALLVLGAGAIWAARRLKVDEETRVFALPYAHPAGIAFTGGALLIGDWYGRTVYEHDPETLAVRAAIPLPREAPVALAWGAGALWATDPEGNVTKRRLDERLTATGRWKLAEGEVVGLCFDGLYLWTAHRSGRLLVKRIPDEELTAAGAWPYPGSGRPAAIACDRRGLWSVDEGGELLRHDLADPEAVADRSKLGGYGPGWKVSGLASAADRLWSVAESSGSGPGRAVRHAGRPW